MSETIKQKHYGEIEIDDTKSDIIQIWNHQWQSDLIQVERENIPLLIQSLQKLIDK